MLDIKFIRENPDKVKEGCRKKGVEIDIEKLLEIDNKRREAIQRLEKIRAEKNRGSRLISRTKDEKERKNLIFKMRDLDKEEEKLQTTVKTVTEEFNSLMLQIPNIPLEDVPLGKDENDNVVLRKKGEKPTFDFKPREHFEIGQILDIIDIKRAAKVAGSRFDYLKGDIVLLEFALVKLAFDTLLKKGFVPVLPPVMLKPEMARGTGYFEASDINEAYFLPKDNLFLTATAEQSLLTMHQGEVFREEDLPRRYLGFSTCFRREAGSYGRDVKGILRVHQFDKLEMFSFCKPEDSERELEFFLSNEEELMDKLNLPYQVVKICTGDLGFPAAKKYDIEAWMPGQGRYRETHSTSSCTDFQARRLNIRYRTKKGKLGFVHTVNGTAFSQRPLLAILENYQQKDGSVKIPPVLQKYVGKSEIRVK